MQSPASPCVRVCTLDDEQFCLGCGRHIDEIVAWSSLSAVERQAVLDAIERRGRPLQAPVPRTYRKF